MVQSKARQIVDNMNEGILHTRPCTTSAIERRTLVGLSNPGITPVNISRISLESFERVHTTKVIQPPGKHNTSAQYYVSDKIKHDRSNSLMTTPIDTHVFEASLPSLSELL